jgi:hypothetical protein
MRNWEHKEAQYKVLPGKLKADTRCSILWYYEGLVSSDVRRNGNMRTVKFAATFPNTVSSMLSH